jgi:hypothetical protein
MPQREVDTTVSKQAPSWYRTCNARPRGKGLHVISSSDAKLRRIIRLNAQILRTSESTDPDALLTSESTDPDALLKAFFNDNPLILASKCGNWSNL